MHTLRRFLKLGNFFIGCLGILYLAAGSPGAFAQDSKDADKKPAIIQAVMCEEIRDYEPHNIAAVFSIAIGKVYCFTSFNSIPRNMFVYHSWYRRDRLITTRRLSLKTPEWSVFSTIQLREADKGPWRVEIKDNNSRILKIIKFGITE
ncbi:MAG: DUF2914 domain-containing protein [Deltaproteobacteria bacterium]|nr:DUF2914 domain-containing protein [Deltaproteobacteria bacterium]